jgi:hypothetical protein
MRINNYATFIILVYAIPLLFILSAYHKLILCIQVFVLECGMCFIKCMERTDFVFLGVCTWGGSAIFPYLDITFC